MKSAGAKSIDSSKQLLDDWLCILNPAAGQLRNLKFRSRWSAAIRELGIKVTQTDGPGSAGQIAASAKEYAGVIAFGGDGTIFEVINAIDIDRQKFAAFPGGRGNGIARELGIETMEDALESIKRGKIRHTDLISCEIDQDNGATSSFLAMNALAFGPLPTIMDRSRRLSFLGAKAYALFGFLSGSNGGRYDINMENAKTDNHTLSGIVIGNTQYLGRYVAFPSGSTTDGLLDVMFLPAGLIREKLVEIGLLSGIQAFAAPIRSCEYLSVRLDHPAPLFVDGEVLVGVKSIRATCKPGALACIELDPL